jgi:glycosyltransferase involved in cell wall biosynthesis
VRVVTGGQASSEVLSPPPRFPALSGIIAVVREGSSQNDERLGPLPEVVVTISGGQDAGAVAATVKAVVATTPPEVPIVVDGQRSGDPKAAEGEGREIAYVADRPTAPPGADIVLLEAGVIPPAGWLALLAGIAHTSLATATVSGLRADEALTRSGQGLDAAARAVADAALRLHPRHAGPRGPCVYVRRTALDLIQWTGPLTADPHRRAFAELCVQAGLSHVLADELLIDGRGARPVAPGEGEDGDGVARAVGVARRALTGLVVVIDGRVDGQRRDGTWVHVLELIAALGRSDGAEVRVIVPEPLDHDLRARLEAMPGVLPMTLPAALAVGAIADVVHRPFQVSAPADLAALAPLAHRLLITHQDLISFHNPSYFPSPEAWTGYQGLTRQALAAADHVAFFSEHVRRGALAADLAEPQRATVVPIGVDHAVSTDAIPGIAPAAARRFDAEDELLLCLGTDFRHKNRLFALRTLEQLQSRHYWTGWLLLAGPRVKYGSSRSEEQAFLAAHPSVADHVLDLGPVSGPEREWLLERADLVLYPTVEEGFGLVPFEAAERGTPCLWAAGSALAEVLAPEIAIIVPWDAAATADRAHMVLRDPVERVALIDAVMERGARLRWASTARSLLRLYDDVCRQPPSPAGALARSGGLMQSGLSEDAIRLVGPGGLLPRDVERPLLALASHRRLAGPVLGLLRAGYRASRQAARRRGSTRPD